MKVIKLKETDSTNRVAKELASKGAPEWTVVCAKTQTDGRGRMGKTFFSPEGNLYMSIILRPSFRSENALLITTAAAAAVYDAVEEIFCENPHIKWVNDLYLRNRKICGILAEAIFSENTLDCVILGIGVNVSKPKGEIPTDIKNIYGYICETTDEKAADKLCISIVEKFKVYYNNLESKPHLEKYRARLGLCGKEITVLQNGSETPAVALGIDDDFKLLVKYTDGTEGALSFGEVSIKGNFYD